MLSRHYRATSEVAAPATCVFEHLDDHTRLSAHMSKPSWTMGGGSLQIEVDGLAGKGVGSRIRLAGRVFGLELSVEEVVKERVPPLRKTWETVGTPKLLVIGNYRLGFTVTPASERSTLQVCIDYELPGRGLTRVLGWLFADFYARWCVQQMIGDVVARFASMANADIMRPDGRSTT